MRIAAVIPTYNAAAFIDGTLESIFFQTRLPDEIIVADDASTDATFAILERWKRKHNLPMTLISLPVNSGGPAIPLNTAIERTKCEWIATLDHDDRWHRTWLDSALHAAQSSGLELILGRVAVSPENQAAQQELDIRADQIRAKAESIDTHVARLASRTAYAELVPSLSYGITCSNMFFSKRLALAFPFDSNVTRCCDYRFLQQITETHDIALLNSYSCDWVNVSGSMFQRGDITLLDRDLLYVYEKFDPSRLPPDLCEELKSKIGRTAYDLAYEARERGDYRQAMLDYRISMNYSGTSNPALKGFLKTVWKRFWSLR